MPFTQIIAFLSYLDNLANPLNSTLIYSYSFLFKSIVSSMTTPCNMKNLDTIFTASAWRSDIMTATGGIGVVLSQKAMKCLSKVTARGERNLI